MGESCETPMLQSPGSSPAQNLHMFTNPKEIWYSTVWASPVAQWVKNLPAMQETQETWVWFLGQEDPLEKEIGTYSSIPAWKIPWAEEPGGWYPMVCKESDKTEQLSMHIALEMLEENLRQSKIKSQWKC